ncbi:hypothetical protein JCM5350_007061 [Sporobolomyces pararoseus]
MQSSFALSSSEGEVLDLTRSPTPLDEVLVLQDEDEALSDDILFPPSSPSDLLMRRPNLARIRSSSSSYQQQKPKEEPIGIKAISFGVFGDSNSFSAEWEAQASGKDGLCFENGEGRGTKKSIVIEVTRADRSSIRISIEMTTVTRIQRSSGGKSFYLHLRLPPLLYTLPPRLNGDTSQHSTQVAAFDREHARIAPFSKVIRINLRDSREVPVFLSRAQQYGLPRIISSKIGLETIGDILEVQGSGKTERILVLFADSLAKLEELGEETPPEIVLSDDEGDGRLENSTESRKNKKRRRDPSPVRAQSEEENRSETLEAEEDEDDSGDEHDVILPPAFLPTQSSGPHNPHDLSVSQLITLLNHSVTRSIIFAPLYSSVDSSNLSRTVTLTPTSFILGGPNLESSNSIVRKYGRPENFLRVAIRNEDGTLLERSSSSIVDSRFKRLFIEGFELAGRKWEFLAWSASALKNQACFFVSPFEVDGKIYTPAVIHEEIGDFKGDPTARIPAKYFARISQAFTSSRPSIALRPDQIIQLPDLVSETGSLFSDGVGTISPSLAEDVKAALGIGAEGGRSFTCFQVRIGGAKGMLQVDPSLAGKQIGLRPSQIKFKSSSSSLEIADTFIAKTGFLNRPLIKLLEDLDVSATPLLKLQKSATERIRKSRGKLSSAIRLLEDWTLSHSSRLSSTLSFLDLEKSTSQAGFSNPFVSQLLDAAVIHVLRDVKYKSRIPLPGCYNLVGVVDISDTLEEDEIYAKIQHSDGKIEYLKGEIAISRSPTNHPGDVRRVRAVGNLPAGRGERIRDLVNCVVFPAKGERSLPSMLAGGDLDGDLYLLLTESSGLLPKSFSSPAAYDAAPPTRLDRDATMEDGIDFFFEYASRDLTAMVATRQLLLADFYPEGLFHPDCLKLAQLHSDSVDYVKSGTPVPISEVPRIPFKMKERGGRPDFASLPGQDSYLSPRALGQLYRAIDNDLIKPPQLETSLVDPGRTITKALLSLKLKDDSRLPSKPPRQLVEYFKSFLRPFSSELGKLADLCFPPAKEEELFLHILVKHKIERGDKNLLSNRGERIDELFTLVREEITARGSPEDTRGVVERAWAAWIAVVEADEEHAQKRKREHSKEEQQQGKFGFRSWGFLALSVFAEYAGKMEKKEEGGVEVIILD